MWKVIFGRSRPARFFATAPRRQSGTVPPARTRSRRLALAIALACTAPALTAQGQPAEGSGARTESPVVYPAAPKAHNLHPIYVSATASQTFLVDLASVSVEPGDIVRYTLVSTSPAGARNISYEGIRCDPQQIRVYAYHRNDGTWSPSSREAWEPAPRNVTNRPYEALIQDYFCALGGPKSIDAILRSIRDNASAAGRGS